MENRALDSRNDYGFGPSTDYDDVSYGDSSNFGWNMFLFAVAVAMIAVNWGFLRPASRQLDQMQAQVKTLERTIAQLTKQESVAAGANNLLTLLNDQGRRTELASASLVRIQQLHNRLVGETGRYNDAAVALDRLGALRADVAAQAQKIDVTRQALRDIAQLQRQLLVASSASPQAEESLSRLEAIQSRIAKSGDTLLQAELLVDDVDSLHRHLLGTSELHGKAHQVVDQLVDMSESLVEEADAATDAQLTLGGLIDLRETIDAQSLDVSKSQVTLNQLVGLKDDVLAQTDGIADAIVTLERTSDLSEQFQAAAQGFETWRRWLTEVVMMEPTVRRAMESLEPITALGNLRRVSPDELRQAAAVVQDMRQTEIAQAKDRSPAEGPTEVANAATTDGKL